MPTARRDTPVHDHAFPVWRDFDADYSETLSKPDGGPRFGPADIGALGDPCHSKGTPPGRLGFVSNDGKYGHRIRVQMFSYRGWYDHSGSKKSTAPHTSDAVRLVPIFRHRGLDPRLNFTIPLAQTEGKIRAAAFRQRPLEFARATLSQ